MLEAQPGVKALALSQHKSGEVKRLLALCKQLVPHRGTALKPLRAMVVGIPNVGKSTMLNTLLGKRLAKVGDEPAITTRQQRVELEPNFFLADTPGILWPNIEDPVAGMRLAASGAVGKNALDLEEVAGFLALFLRTRYPALLKARYKLDELPENQDELLDLIGRRRGCLVAGGAVDRAKAADVLLNDFRGGDLGRISLETPADFPPAEPAPT